MELPRVNPVGVLEWPEEAAPASASDSSSSSPSAPSARRFSRPVRALAVLLLVLFALTTVVTSAVSLGAYCLTTEPGDIRTLPAGSPEQPPDRW